ncbi:hypothetical protein [Salinibacterium sp.]|uniref:hypothetical protein n=1 Tax=Salinibacterium sp. TaxID=1915057 RepID=UPI00286B28CA|nr:hypothetical protein [Salinibacterium sp.]
MLTDDELTAIARSGGHISVSPRIEMQVGSLTVGKKADIIVLRPDYTELAVANDIAGAT